MATSGILKIIGGIVLVLIGLWLLIPQYGLNLWTYLWNLILGFVPIFLVIIGILIIWIESEELKFEKPKKK
jgi:membrane-bound ClpP family serine protease